MLYINRMMKKILVDTNTKASNLEMTLFLNDIVKHIKVFQNCVVYDQEDRLDEKNINYQKIIQFYGDMIGYEASCNELRFNRDIMPYFDYLKLANQFNIMLKKISNGRDFAVYISIYEDEFELRFHTYTKDNKTWLDEELDIYDIPILCVI